jgi:hypothetical protein
VTSEPAYFFSVALPEPELPVSELDEPELFDESDLLSDLPSEDLPSEDLFSTEDEPWLPDDPPFDPPLA